jgi:hypothetical protein
VEYFDQPTVRKIVADAEKNDFRMSSLIVGVAMSDAFRMKHASTVTTESSNQSRQQ